MKLERISLYNWRSFYGRNDFFISDDPKKNVTLIRAENGVGKTSFLAALNWCFYNILPDEGEFENRDELVNKYAMKSDKADQTWVEIDFEHQGKRYRAKRQYNQSTKKTGGIGVEEISEGGEVPISAGINKDRFIGSVLPKEMAPHFFFYGESTGRYTGSSGARKFGQAVKGILGSTIAQMTLTDLEKVVSEFTKEAANTAGEDEKIVEAEMSRYDGLIADTEIQIERYQKESLKAQDERSKLDTQLAGFENAKDDQRKRSQYESSLSSVNTKLKRAKETNDAWLRKYGIAILADELITEASKVADQEDTRGKIPAPYNEQFVMKVLGDEKCICGADLTKGSPAHEAIKSMLDTAGDQIVESRIIHIKSCIGSLKGTAKGAWDAKEANEEHIASLEVDRRRIAAEIEIISKKMKDNPIKDIGRLEQARNTQDSIVRKSFGEIGRLEERISQFKRSKSAKQSELTRLLRESAQAARFVKRAQLAAALFARLSSRLTREEDQARKSIAREIDNIVDSVLRKDVSIELDKNYQLKMKNDGKELAKSTGENQLLGLAFTAAIAKYAKDRRDSDDDILLPGTVAPLVVDSPFGHLDPTYRLSVAEFLPRLANQVILLVSTSQASGGVIDQLEDSIGYQYVLTRHNKNDQGVKKSESVEIDGKHYDLTKYSSDIEGTKITSVGTKK